MIQSLEFLRFRVLRKARLPLQRVTVLLGPNGSGKSTVLKSLDALARPTTFHHSDLITLGESEPSADVRVTATLEAGGQYWRGWRPGSAFGSEANLDVRSAFERMRTFALDPLTIANHTSLRRDIELSARGDGLGAVLTNLQDRFPERFEALNEDLANWLPEFDRVLLDTPFDNARSFLLRTREGRHQVPARVLSEGTLMSVAFLTLSHLPEPPTVIGLEEPDRAVHPRLLRDVQEAINRLAHPEQFDDDRAPVQVILTTHSPYMVDLYRDSPESIVLCNRVGMNVEFKRLSDQPNVEEILDGVKSLGEIWYSGALGGVPIGK